MITPGGNPYCNKCETWYGPGEEHVCGSCVCGEPMDGHGWSDPPHMPISQDDYYREWTEEE